MAQSAEYVTFVTTVVYLRFHSTAMGVIEAVVKFRGVSELWLRLVCLSICLSVRLYVRPSVCPSDRPSARLSVRLLVSPSVCPSICLSLCRSARPSALM
jgi:hypothetical protein